MDICSTLLDTDAPLLGQEIGRRQAIGGVDVAGGIALKILPKMKDGMVLPRVPRQDEALSGADVYSDLCRSQADRRFPSGGLGLRLVQSF